MGWWIQKRKGVLWFGAAIAGALAGDALALPWWSWAALATLAFGGLLVRRRGDDGWWSLVFLAFIASLTAHSVAVRHVEFALREAHYPRGERRLLHGRVVDVTPHPGGRLALVVIDESVAPAPFAPWGRGELWIRLVGEVDELLAMVAQLPPGEGGRIAWPVRVYPFAPAGNPGEFDARAWALRRGIVATAYLDGAGVAAGERWRSAGGGDPGHRSHTACSHSEAALELYRAFGIDAPVRELAWRWRCRLAGAGSGGASAIAVGMVLGQRDLIDPDLEAAFARAGLGHLLAVSGLHVGFVVALVMPVVAVVAGSKAASGPRPPIGGRQWLGLGLLAFAVLFYVALTGGPPSAARAGVMALAGLVARQVGRPVDSWHVLGIAGTLLLAHQPTYALDLGFQMSFLAVAGILGALGPRDAQRSKNALSVVVTGLRVTLGAQIATLPLVAATFSEFSWVSPGVNLVAVPLGGAAVTLLLTGALIGEFAAVPGSWLIVLGHRVLELLVAVARAVPSWGAIEVPMPPALVTYGWYTAWFAVAVFHRASRQPAPAALVRFARHSLVGGAVMIAVGLSWPAVKSLLGVTEIWVLDVGQGDAVLVRSGLGRAVMIDGGGVPGAAATGGFDVGERRVVPTLKRLGVRRLDAVISTHPDEDHLHGLVAVLRQREVKAVFAPESESSGAAYKAFVQAVSDKGLSLQRLSPGQSFVLGAGASLEALAGGRLVEWGSGAGRRLPPVNDRSIVLLLRHPGGRALLAGDIEERGQRRLLELEARRVEPAVAGVDMLLLPHHGDKVSAATGFLEVARPRVAVISVGPNRYGHPAREVLERLEQLGARVWRTDRHGAVRVEFWPWGVRVNSVR